MNVKRSISGSCGEPLALIHYIMDTSIGTLLTDGQ